MCAGAQDIGYVQTFGKLRELDHGSRSKPVDKLGCELLAGNDTEQVNNRTDWLSLNINAALSTKAVPMFLPATKALTFGATASSVQATTPPLVTQPTEPAVTEMPALTASEAEENLTTLKRLHDKGLITDTECEEKRAVVMKGL